LRFQGIFALFSAETAIFRLVPANFYDTPFPGISQDKLRKILLKIYQAEA